ncbi:hypothetical protein Cgig2_007455 [Carnegiea gigantea]|uniref:Uncharacterized protein n=1 Tax=Carnegiea gigantea TaxID=171969 RepID=A0A9Q1GRX8_9CARY|nr:hypothetical protein Cgig2_007455 [Carnegiea gigantea]
MKQRRLMTYIYTIKDNNDGYNSGFFKDNWDITGSLICAAIKEFFAKDQGATKLVTLPKVIQNMPQSSGQPLASLTQMHNKGFGGKILSRVKTWSSKAISYNTCTPEGKDGLGIKNLKIWNDASIAKLVWALRIKKDLLWVKWIHEIYPRGKNS